MIIFELPLSILKFLAAHGQRSMLFKVETAFLNVITLIENA